MRESRDTLFRYLALLQLLPQWPKSITTSEILEKLKNLNPDYAVDKRSIQRDLNKLSAEFAITCETEGRTNRWYWSDKNSFTQIPAMSESTALALRFAQEYLQDIMPPATLKILNPYFEHAKEVLKSTRLDRWTAKVKIIKRGPELIPPKISPAVQAAVYQALLEGKKIKALYQGRNKDKPSEYIMSPEGLVMREGIIYLVASLWNYADIRHFPLQRMQKAEVLNEPAQSLPGFSLQKHIEQDKEFSYPVSRKNIKLKILVNNYIARHLSECRLSEDQKIKPQDEDSVIIEATVPDTYDLRWWLLGFGDQVEVLAPKSLRNEFTELAASMRDIYKTK